MIDDQYPMEDTFSQLPKGEKSHKDVQGKREDARTKREGVILKVVDSSSHLPPSSPADFHSKANIRQDEKARLRKHNTSNCKRKGHAQQSKSNKRDMGSPVDSCNTGLSNQGENND